MRAVNSKGLWEEFGWVGWCFARIISYMMLYSSTKQIQYFNPSLFVFFTKLVSWASVVYI